MMMTWVDLVADREQFLFCLILGLGIAAAMLACALMAVRRDSLSWSARRRLPGHDRGEFPTMVSSNPEWSRSVAATFALCSIGSTLFILDVATPLGVADGVGYPALLAAALWMPGRRWTFVVAAIYSVLIVVAHLAGHGGVGSSALINRFFALVTLWVMAGVIDQVKRR